MQPKGVCALDLERLRGNAAVKGAQHNSAGEEENTIKLRSQLNRMYFEIRLDKNANDVAQTPIVVRRCRNVTNQSRALANAAEMAIVCDVHRRIINS